MKEYIEKQNIKNDSQEKFQLKPKKGKFDKFPDDYNEMEIEFDEQNVLI